MEFRINKPNPKPTLDVESESCVDFVTDFAKKGKWYMIYLLSKSVSREVSILVDSKDNYWIDWGTIGRVELSPPVGAVLPFKLWVHTHPSNTAYWSVTDRNTLEIAKGILEKALVLGEDGLLSTTFQPVSSFTDDTEISTLQWTEEEVIDWMEFNSDDCENDLRDDFYSYLKLIMSSSKLIPDDFFSNGKYW
tara:strand:- start:367 stop:942 length:576 start_codon:yes stop_codon:yes gene_type:complete